MKKLALSALALAFSAGMAAAADPIFGIWQTEPDEGSYSHVDIKQCGSVICGVIVRRFDANGEQNSPHVGKQLVRELVNNGDGTYSGKAWRPSNNKTYIGKATLKGDSLRMKGCVLGGLICRGQTWARIK